MTAISILLNLLNMYTDYALAVVYITSGDLYFGGWTLGFVVVPSLFISLFTFILHKKSNGKFLMKVHVSKPVVYTLCVLLHGHVARCLMWLILLVKKETLFGMRKALWAFRDITSYAETFTHSLPQLCMQLYVMVIYTGKPTPLQYISFVSSWISAAWAIQSQFNGLKWKLLSFEINLCWFASRATAAIMIASVSKMAPFLLLSVHFLLMFPLWFFQNKFKPCRKKRGTNRFELIVTDAFYAAIYAGSNTATPITCKYQLPLAVLLLFENLFCVFYGMFYGKISRHIEHFKAHRVDYHFENSTQVLADCSQQISSKNDIDGSDVYSKFCQIEFDTWIKSSMTVAFAFTVTILGFLQVVVIVLLRYRKVIEEEAMISKLGSFEFREKNGNHNSNGNKDNKHMVVTTTTDLSTPKTSPSARVKPSPSQLHNNSNNKDGGRSSGSSSLSLSFCQKNEFLNGDGSGDNIEVITFEKEARPFYSINKDDSRSGPDPLLNHCTINNKQNNDRNSSISSQKKTKATVEEHITFEKGSPSCRTDRTENSAHNNIENIRDKQQPALLKEGSSRNGESTLTTDNLNANKDKSMKHPSQKNINDSENQKSDKQESPLSETGIIQSLQFTVFDDNHNQNN